MNQKHQCEHCLKEFATNGNLSRHIDSCKVLNDMNIKHKIEELSNEIKLKDELLQKHKEYFEQTKKEFMEEMKTKEEIFKVKEQSLRGQVSAQRDDILLLKTNLANAEKTIVKLEKNSVRDQERIEIIMKKAMDKNSSVVNNNNNNSVVIYNLETHITPEKIQTMTDAHFEKYIHEGLRGVVKFTKNHLITDERGNLNYKCSDASRGKFVYKTADDVEIIDINAHKLISMVKPVSQVKTQEYINKHLEDKSYHEEQLARNAFYNGPEYVEEQKARIDLEQKHINSGLHMKMQLLEINKPEKKLSLLLKKELC